MNLISAPAPVRFVAKAVAPIFARMPKTVYQLRYFRRAGRFASFRSPRNLQETINTTMMKAIGKPAQMKQMAMLADKLGVRSFVTQRVGEEALTKLYGAWKSADDIDFDALPVPCVLKTNNGCGTNLIVRSRAEIDPERMRRTLREWLEYPYGDLTGQPHYSLIPPMILAEEFLDQNPGSDDLPYDYKFFCFNGEPRFILFYSGRKPNSHFTYNLVYDLDWKLIEGAAVTPDPHKAPRPETLDAMIMMARQLSKGLPFVRVDFYSIGPRVVFGEMTLTPDVLTNFTPEFLKKHRNL